MRHVFICRSEGRRWIPSLSSVSVQCRHRQLACHRPVSRVIATFHCVVRGLRFSLGVSHLVGIFAPFVGGTHTFLRTTEENGRDGWLTDAARSPIRSEAMRATLYKRPVVAVFGVLLFVCSTTCLRVHPVLNSHSQVLSPADQKPPLRRWSL